MLNARHCMNVRGFISFGFKEVKLTCKKDAFYRPIE